MNKLLARSSIVRRYTTGGKLPSYALKPAFGAPDAVAAKAFRESLQATQTHAKGTSDLWFKIALWAAAPAILITAVNTYFVEKEHAEHRKHLAHVPDEDWPHDYEFMNQRHKPFFWGNGDKSLFWNPIVNRHIEHD
ncbi:cytochrome c oxidase subunit VIa KNAG_0G01330 [Huiozyma naganishii CBS 8797]|uniref:Cytochrome c oxidase subunit 13, mitochondrial n=1 Tax=Huiozyma naganishii (strain ATCC MYA-139 / BCRC 22969 / CBS 8797 / KCTC 17520 / NBRC 10181 / NCYC 3082 / Yp74L-3) TaxID=1071383 RepID=J7S8Z1_HUIN7|nr:hypothetical protein KNAG_0G01330 [Kazachstania naganishii CBS 8797]CCK71191.1 hypothetical protein KNAG_0G01330 [Kazachstania naganishii CBS 8797]